MWICVLCAGRLGSLKRAVEHLGMSHRNAWGYLWELERAAGFKMLERQPGGGPRSGMRLTRQGREFLAHYRQFRQDVDAGIARQFRRASKSR